MSTVSLHKSQLRRDRLEISDLEIPRLKKCLFSSTPIRTLGVSAGDCRTKQPRLTASQRRTHYTRVLCTRVFDYVTLLNFNGS